MFIYCFSRYLVLFSGLEMVDFRMKVVLPNQTWVYLPTCSKANLLTLGCGEGKYSMYRRAPSKESRQLVLKRPQLPEGFQRKVFKNRVREGVFGVCYQHMDILLIGWW